MNMNNIEEKFDDLQTILNSSKEFNFKNDSILNWNNIMVIKKFI